MVLASVFALGAARAEEVAVVAEPKVVTGGPAKGDDFGCRRWRHPGLLDGPVAVGLFEADLATGRRACPRSELSLYARGGAIIDTPNFYGALAADAVLAGSWAPTPRAEVFAAIELVHFQFVQNASLKGTDTGLGQLTVGGSYVALEREKVVFTPYARLMLPTSTATPRVRTIGAEAGFAVAYRPFTKLALHGSLGADLSAGLSAADAGIRSGAVLIAGLQYSPWTWLGLVLDIQTHFGHRAALDYLAPAIAFRFRVYRTLGIELAAAMPLVGADRRLAVASLRLSWRF